MARDKAIELTLHKAALDLPPRVARGATKRMIIVTLVWPRPRIEGQVAARTVAFQDGAVDLSKASWTDRIMMKELVSGPFGLRAAVTERVAEPLAADFLRFLGSSILRMGASEAEDAAATALGGGLAKLPLTFLGNVIAKGASGQPKTVASGSVDLDTDTLLKAKKIATVKVPIVAPRDIYASPESTRGTRAKKKRLVVKKGAACGSVTLKAKAHP